MTAQAAPINVTGTGIAYTGPCTYRGFALAVATSSAVVTIYDGVTAAGTVLAQFTAATAGQFFADDISDGVRCVNGVFVNVSSGAVAGHVRVS